MLLTKELTLDLEIPLSLSQLFALMTSQASHPPYTLFSQEGSPGRHHLFNNDGPTCFLFLVQFNASYISL